MSAPENVARPFSRPLASRKRLVLLLVLIPSLFIGGGWFWFQFRFNTESGAVTVADPEKWKEFARLERYAGDKINTIDTITDEVKAALTILSADLQNVDDEVRATEKHLRTADPHLDKALRDPANTPLVGPQGGRTVRDTISDRHKIAELLIADFVTNTAEPDRVKESLKLTLLDLCTKIMSTGEDFSESLVAIRHAYDAGVRDPLVVYALILVQGYGTEERFRLFQEADASLRIRNACPLLRFLITVKAQEFKTRWSPREYVPYQDRATEALFAAISAHADDASLVKFLKPHCLWLFWAMNGAARTDFIIRMVSLPREKFPMWLQHYVVYRFAVDIANHYRGSNYISDTPPEDVERFDKYSKIASNHLLRAWTLQPDCRDIPVDLMVLQARSGNTSYSDHQWFRFAIAEAFDDETTYEYFASHLVPRWGGSHEELIRYADLCSQVRFEDNPTPLYAYQLIWRKLEELPRQLRLSGDLRLLKTVLQTIDYLKHSPSKGAGQFGGGRAWCALRVLWDAGRFSEINWLIDNYGNDLSDNTHYVTYFLNPKFIKAFSKAATDGDIGLWLSLHNDVLMNSDKLSPIKVNQARLAIAELRQQTDEQSTWVLDNCDKICDWWTTFNQGDPVTLDIDANKLGWNLFVNSPTFIEGGYEFTAGTFDTHSVAYPMLRFPMPHAIEAEVELLDGTADLLGIALFAGPLTNKAMGSGFAGGVLRFQPTSGRLAQDSLPGNRLDDNNPYLSAYVVADKGKTKLRMEVRPDGIQSIVQKSKLDVVSREINTLGFVAFGRWMPDWIAPNDTPTSYRITNMKVIPLDDATVEN